MVSTIHGQWPQRRRLPMVICHNADLSVCYDNVSGLIS